MRFKRRPVPLADLLQMQHAAQEREHSFYRHTLVFLTSVADREVVRVISRKPPDPPPKQSNDKSQVDIRPRFGTVRRITILQRAECLSFIIPCMMRESPRRHRTRYCRRRAMRKVGWRSCAFWSNHSAATSTESPSICARPRWMTWDSCPRYALSETCAAARIGLAVQIRV